jgi:hypothetical protein
MTPEMSETCKHFIRWTIRGVPRIPFQYLCELHERELFRALATPAREDIRKLFEDQAKAPGAAMRAGTADRLSQIRYAYEIVSKARLSSTNPALTDGGEIWAHNYLHDCEAGRGAPLYLDEDLTGQLPAPTNSPPRLTDSDYAVAATKLGVDVASIKAVATVESAGSGFGAGGRPIIRYELHRFQRKTGHHFYQTHPHLSQRTWKAGEHYHNGKQTREYSMLFSAMLLRYHGASVAHEAIESASWGKFQIMGENWRAFGWPSAAQFAADMYVSEANQLSAFVKFVKHNHLDNALKQHNWAAFAAGFNGPGYATNQYDIRLKQAFDQFSGSAGAQP